MARLDSPAQALLDTLHADHQSGATELALKTLRNLADYVRLQRPKPALLTDLVNKLRDARPSMVVIASAMIRVQERLQAKDGEPVAAIEAVYRELTDATDALINHARSQIPEGAVIMTHSASSVLERLFQRLMEEHVGFSVICTQSSPGHEGHQLANLLNKLGVPVTLITDAQMGVFVATADLVLTGCDSWLTDGHFVNKSGTRLLALAARERSVPFWVLADSFRDSTESSDRVILEELPAQQLGAPKGQWITVRNLYFETIPQHLVTGRISEQGVFSYPFP
ncbi:translation initiation factor eIF-2B [Marinobacter alexandrii]|jgi:translation initiation factor 2B subunit (eIF-2B alpha/beta/delta family)|uniref:translation initiation factor eIF-2B n=1 Tax=Marinobacter alexandrii TaxID=2570351 RepID=UPI001107E420|nr:initiation factor 2B [Marinobacter alexandrii]